RGLFQRLSRSRRPVLAAAHGSALRKQSVRRVHAHRFRLATKCGEIAVSQVAHRTRSPWPALALIALAAFGALPAQAAKLTDVIRDAQRKTVKIYGAGGIRGLEAYQSGFLISAEGHVLTAFSYVLDSDTITVTLDDGRKFEAKLLGADPRLDLAV